MTYDHWRAPAADLRRHVRPPNLEKKSALEKCVFHIWTTYNTHMTPSERKQINIYFPKANWYLPP